MFRMISLAAAGLGLIAFTILVIQVNERPLAKFAGHKAGIDDVFASPDGKTLVSMSADHTLKVWDVPTGAERASFPGTTAVFSADSTTLAWTDGTTIRLWSVASGKEMSRFGGRQGQFCSLAFSPDTKSLASGCEDGTIKLWNVVSGREQATWLHGGGRIYSVRPLQFSPDGKTLASGTYACVPGGAIKLWDVARHTARATLRVPSCDVTSFCFSPDGKLLAAGGDPATLWDIATGRQTATLDTPEEGVEGLVFSSDGRTLAAVPRCGPELYRWDVHTGKTIATWKRSCPRPRPRVFRYIWDAFPCIFEEHDFIPRSVCFTAGGVMTLGFDNRDETTIEMWRASGL